MGNSKYFDLLKDVKQYATTCLEKQKELIDVLTTKKKEMQERRTISNAFKAHGIRSKFLQLNPGKFSTGTYIYSKITSWLNEDKDNSFVKRFGTNYDGKYLFRFNNKRLAENLLKKPLVKKVLYTNIIAKDKNGVWINENPYCTGYEEFYHPVKITAFCDENFNTDKRYSLEQLKKLVEDKVIVLESNLQVDAYNYTNVNSVSDLIKNKEAFAIGKVKYTPKDSVVTCLFNSVKVPIEDGLRIPKLNDIYEELMGDFNEYRFNDYMICYPNLVDCIEDEIVNKLNNDILTEKKKTEFIKEYYNNYVKKAIAKFKKEIDEERKEIEKLSKNNDLYL